MWQSPIYLLTEVIGVLANVKMKGDACTWGGAGAAGPLDYVSAALEAAWRQGR